VKFLPDDFYQTKAAQSAAEKNKFRGLQPLCFFMFNSIFINSNDYKRIKNNVKRKDEDNLGDY